MKKLQNLLPSDPVDRVTPPEHKRFQFLFFALLTLVVIYPYFQESGLHIRIYRLLGAAIVLASFYAVADDRRKLIPALLLGIPAIITQVIAQLAGQSELLRLINNFTNIPLIVFICVVVFLKVIRSRRVTVDTLYGAASVYLLMGFAFALGFLALVQVDPTAFYMAEAHNPDGVIDFSDTIYFSFVTLTTLGYGDMAPVSPIARSFAILEAMLGVLYLAILISRLVSIYTTTQTAYDEPVEENDSEERA